MQFKEYTVVNIRDYLRYNEEGETREELLKKTLAGFTCPLNLSIEKYLKEQAVEFTKKNQSVTYLVFFKEDATLVGFFTLAAKPIIVKILMFSKTMQKKIARVSEINEKHQTFHLSAYLIAQIGKNFQNGANKKITGKRLMEIAIMQIKELQYMLGGMVTFLEAEENNKLLEFYKKENDFKELIHEKQNLWIIKSLFSC